MRIAWFLSRIPGFTNFEDWSIADAVGSFSPHGEVQQSAKYSLDIFQPPQSSRGRCRKRKTVDCSIGNRALDNVLDLCEIGK